MVQSTRPTPPWSAPAPKLNWFKTKQERDIAMAKWEINKRVGNLYDAAWWRWMPGETISVAWPVGKIIIVDETDSRWSWAMSASRQSFESADPNDHYRPELESLVGKQGWDWNWGLRDNNVAENRLTIKIRKSKAKYASYFAMKWG